MEEDTVICWSSIAGSIHFKKTTPYHFSSCFGVTIQICSLLWSFIFPFNSKLKPKHLLYCLYYFKTYPLQAIIETEREVDHKTFFKWVWIVVDLLYDHLDMIQWGNRFDEWNHLQPSCIVDTTLCPIADPFYDQWMYYSMKHKKSGLKYEVAIHMKRDEIVWVRGGIAGAVHDITIAKESLVKNLMIGEAPLADRGYQTASGNFVTPVKNARTLEDIHYNTMLEKRRWRIEAVNKRLKIFRIIKESFRSDIEKHAKIFIVICHITNIKMISNPLKRTKKVEK